LSGFPAPRPPLADDLVVLRPWEERDVAVLASWAQDAEIARWTALTPGYDEHHARAFRSHAHRERTSGHAMYLAIADAHTGIAVGSCDLRRPLSEDPRLGEIGYMLGPESRGRGLATSAVRLLVRYGLEQLGMVRVQALVHPGNALSLRVLERAGFTREGVLRGYREGPGGGREDRVVLSVVAAC
jgi:RimJ/RimL family protein N-acetyltransferase